MFRSKRWKATTDARELFSDGHEVRLIPPIYVKRTVKRARMTPTRSSRSHGATRDAVPVKSAASQATLMLHKTRELPVKQRTMGVNALRGHHSEFGIVAAKGIGRAGELIAKAESDATLPETAKLALKVLIHPVHEVAALHSSFTNHQRKLHTFRRRAATSCTGCIRGCSQS
jgi:transposase